MADNFDFTPGAGDTCAAEDVGGVKYQRVKLVSGVAAATDPIDGDGNGQLLVNPFGVGSNWCEFHDIASGDAVHTAQELVAVPGAGLHLYITDIILTNSSTAAMTFLFEEDEGGASEAQVLGKIYLPVSANLHIRFATAKKLSENVSFGFTNTGQSNASVTVCGFTAA